MKLKPVPLRRIYAALVLAVVAVVLDALLPEGKTPGWFVLAFFFGLTVLGAVLLLVNLLPGSAFLELTPEGMTIRSLYRNAFFAWADIQEFYPANVGEGWRVRWRHAAGYHRTQPRARNLATRFASFKATLPDTYGYGAEALAALLNKWRLQAAAHPVAPAAPIAPEPQSVPLPSNWALAGKTMTISLDPGTAQTLHRRGVELTMAGKLEEGLADLEAAQKLNPFSYDIHLDKAVTLRFLERFPEALEVCDAAMAVLVIPPATLLLFHQLRGDVLREQGQLEAAIESFQQSLYLHPEPRYAVHPHHQKARLLARLGRHHEALAACEAALGLYPDVESLLELRAELLAADPPAP